MSDKSTARVVLAASCGAIFLPGALIFGFPGVMGHHWQQAFSASRADVGQILFFVLAGAGGCMLLVGRVQERVGPAWLMALGALLTGGSTMLVGRAAGIGGVHAWAFTTGAASAFVYLPAITVVQRWYPRWRGLASGLVSMAFGLSGAVMTPVFSLMLEVQGARLAAFTLGLVALAAGGALALLVRPPAGMPENVPGAAAVSDEPSLTVHQSLQTKSFWLLWFTWAFAGAAGISMVTLAVALGVAKGLALGKAIYILTAFNLTNGLSRLISGYFSDMAGRKETMSAVFLLAGISYFILPHAGAVVALALLAAVIGFAFGTLFSVSAPLVSDCFGMAHFGSIFGLVFTAYGFVAGILGPWFCGYLLDVTSGNFTLVCGYLGALMLASALMVRVTTDHKECRM
jgi:OFA family oxalate/formate antiporter-like MFS transporter